MKATRIRHRIRATNTPRRALALPALCVAEI